MKRSRSRRRTGRADRLIKDGAVRAVRPRMTQDDSATWSLPVRVQSTKTCDDPRPQTPPRTGLFQLGRDSTSNSCEQQQLDLAAGVERVVQGGVFAVAADELVGADVAEQPVGPAGATEVVVAVP